MPSIRNAPYIPTPPDFEHTLVDVFKELVRKTRYTPYLDTCFHVFELAEASLKNTAMITSIQTLYQQINDTDIDAFIHILHLTLFIRELDKNYTLDLQTKRSTTPVTEAVKDLLKTCSLEETLNRLPFSITDVLTSHPVDMDRGIVVNFKRELELLNRKWGHKKMAYRLIKNPHVKLAARAELGDLSQKIRDTLFQLIHTPNYRKNKIKPTSEQRNLSRAIKENENQIIAHWPKLILYVQFCLIEALMHELNLQKTPLDLPRSKENLEKLKENTTLSSHPLFNRILDLETHLNYSLEIWRGDMDGNPFVSGETTALSIAYGRKRCFEGLSADDAVIRFNPQTTAFKQLEKQAKIQLDHVKKTGQPAWKRYIKEREAEDWDAIQTLSGYVYYRMVEMTEAAELYSRTQENLALLHVGFEHEHAFLDASDLLEQAEKISGLQAGIWTQCRQRVQLRGLSLGKPHARKGEKFHVAILEAILPDLKTADLTQKKKSLRAFLTTPVPHKLLENTVFPEEIQTLISNYQTMMTVQNTTTLVQSDSGSFTHDIETSIWVLKAISHLFSQKGDLVILCEDKRSMDQAITLMKNTPPDTDLFHRIVMMCAGSDNQKKTGPFYAHYVNTLFLKTAHQKGIRTFFGIGDSPLRSSTMSVQTDMKTFQPGSRKIHFFGENIFAYLSIQMATQIKNQQHQAQKTTQQDTQEERLFKLLAETVFETYQTQILKRKTLHQEIKSISDIVTTYFSRPSRKTKEKEFVFNQIRAIDSGRAQLIINTFDPQLAGLTEGIQTFQRQAQHMGISKQDIHDFFKQNPAGHSLLKTLAYFAKHLDDALPTDPALRTVSAKDIQTIYDTLSGNKLKVQTDPNLRAVRLLWEHVSRSPKTKPHQAVAMMLFGSNWMI